MSTSAWPDSDSSTSEQLLPFSSISWAQALSMTVWHFSFSRINSVPQISLLKTSQSHMATACCQRLVHHTFLFCHMLKWLLKLRKSQQQGAIWKHAIHYDLIQGLILFLKGITELVRWATVQSVSFYTKNKRENRTTPQKIFALASALTLPLRGL